MFAILPGVGLGSILFGMMETEVNAILGEPSSREQFEDDDVADIGDVDVCYRELGIVLFFHAEEENRLSSLEIDSRCECRLFGFDPFSLTKAALIELLSSRSIPGHGRKEEAPTEEDCVFQTAVNFCHLGMTLYFGEDEKLEDIMWGVLVDENDEIVWPRPG